MKNLILVLILTAAFRTNSVTAQTIQVISQKATFSTGEQNALVTTIYHNPKDVVMNKWKDYLKGFKNEKVKFNNNEMFGGNVFIGDLGILPVNVYTRFEENKDNQSVRMMVAFDLGGTYLSAEENPVKYASMERLVNTFALKTTRSHFEEKLIEAQKNLEKLVNNQKDLEVTRKNLLTSIENYRKKISSAEEDIKQNKEDQAKKEAQIEVQQSAINAIKLDLEGVK